MQITLIINNQNTSVYDWLSDQKPTAVGVRHVEEMEGKTDVFDIFHYSISMMLCRGDHKCSGVPSLYNADDVWQSWHQYFLGPQKIWNCLFLLPASILAKYFNFRIHPCSISMVFSLFLGTAYMCHILLPIFSSLVTQILAQNFRLRSNI